MNRLYDAKVALEKVVRERGLDPIETAGKISLKSGVLLAFVRVDTPDDPVKLEKVRAAVRQLLGAEI
jgi:hypothetical protein